jgi:ribosome biogenesis GTPase
LYALQDLGWTDSHATDFEPYAAEGRVPARVAAQHRGSYVVYSELGELRAEPAGRLTHEAAGAGELPAVGDWVAIAPRPEEDAATIHAVVSRRTKFSRKVALTASEEQVLAANVDAVFLVMSLNEDFNLRRLERYVTMAWESGAKPVIVLTKTDLDPDYALRVLEVEAIAFGIPVHAISSLTGDGLDLIRAHLAPGRTIALLGSSGVGKSTLINTLAGEELLATQTIREHDGEGRHTTRHRQLVLLPGGGLVVDTPGLRELQLWDGGGIEEAFADVEELAGECRFNDCSHTQEPGCAVLAAVRSGDLPSERFQSWRKLQRELRAIEIRHDARLRREERRRWQLIAKEARVRTRHR